MKKLLFTALVAITMMNSACAKTEQLISFEQIPVNAQVVVNQAFANDEISYVSMEKEGFQTEYNIHFASGAKIEFDKNGELKNVDCQLEPVPEQLIPQAVRDYVAAKFPKQFIKEWGTDDRRWKAELNSGLELIFDKKFNFVGIDD